MIIFKGLKFIEGEGQMRFAGFDTTTDKTEKSYNFVEVDVAGGARTIGGKMAGTSESGRLRYVSHTLTENRLIIVHRSEIVETKTVFESYDDTAAVRVYTEVKNVSDENIVLQQISSFLCGGLGDTCVESSKRIYFYKFTQSHHNECQPRRFSLFDFGLHSGSWLMYKRLYSANVGSQSTKAELPQGIIENQDSGRVLMFQIESNNSWYYEISELDSEYYLYLGGANETYGSWSKRLKVGETYKTVNTVIALSDSVSGAINEMTKYRRHIAAVCKPDADLPAIFNEYMHLSGDSPSEETTKKVAPAVAKTGAEYYVIDCGWHNEEPGEDIYPYVGQWKESKTRFPNGVRKTTDFIRSLGMKAGLWIEPEIIGFKCQEMLDYYDDDCFLKRNGKRITVMRRLFLNYRNRKVRDYMSEAIRRMVEDYGADYIKMDYNQDCGIGAENNAYSAGEGLELQADAFLSWIDEQRARFPDVLFETCSSGGMRMDYRTLSHFSIVSTSDQTSYLRYPYIVGNILSAVLPEQAAVWCYPVAAWGDSAPFSETTEWADKNIGTEQVVMNMINGLLGRIHLASHLELLTEEKFRLVQEGVAYYKKLTAIKKRALPYFPLLFTRFGEPLVAAGLETDEKLYLAVWDLDESAKTVEIPLSRKARSAGVSYPLNNTVGYALTDNVLTIEFPCGRIARFFEIEK